jgi:glucuronosyltransferase
MEEASTLFTDRPQKPLDTAEWWTEFILRHGQVNELKPLGIRQSWFQRRLLDVWLVVFSVLFLFPLMAIIAVLIFILGTGNVP